MSSSLANTSTSSRGKRERETQEQGNLPSKKPKPPTKLEKLHQQLQQQGGAAKEALIELQKRGYTTHEGLAPENLGANALVDILIRTCHEIEVGGVSISQETAEALGIRLKDYFLFENPVSVPYGTKAVYRLQIKQAQDRLNQLLETFVKLWREDACPPSASYYGQPAIWQVWQLKDTAIHNLRPSEKPGLPLSVLHPAFAEFIATMKSPSLPNQPLTALANEVAGALCMEMPGIFDDEPGRTKKFIELVCPLIQEVQTEVTIQSDHNLESHTSRVGLYLSIVDSSNIAALLGEVKHEFQTGDAYMQVSRGYQALVHKYEKERSDRLKDGVPCILISLIGPLLMVSGGFYDGKHFIVEPLATPCFMASDYTLDRETYLARLLLTTRLALDSLQCSDTQDQRITPPNTPRVYPLFKSFENHDYPLQFETRLPIGSSSPPRNLIFLASSPELPRLLVKLAMPNRYSIEAHKFLAPAGLAPTLFGIAEVSGAPTAFVMEYLDPSQGWTTLREYLKTNPSIAATQPLHPQLERLLDVMKEGKIAHGDLRPCNIMVRKTKENDVEFNVIDFDWAGRLDDARYPWVRNKTIPWPGVPGAVIGLEDDRTLLMRTLRLALS